MNEGGNPMLVFFSKIIFFQISEFIKKINFHKNTSNNNSWILDLILILNIIISRLKNIKPLMAENKLSKFKNPKSNPSYAW